MRRSGFTLLETMLAALIGTLVLGVAVAMFSLLDRSDRRIGARFEHVMGMERLRTIVTRAMDTLVMSTEPIPAGFENRSVGGPKAGTEPAKPVPPARLLLEQDSSSSVEGVIRRANIRGAGLSAPQRLEVVLQRSPVGAVPADPQQRGRQAVRGAFELRPDEMTPAARRGPVSYASRGTEPGWTLWWRPLPTPATGGGPRGTPAEGDIRSLDPAKDPAAVAIISGLSKCEWTMYRKREKLRDHAAVWALELPAYVELAVTTTAGVSAEWMFEVGWSNAPELVEEPLTPAAEEGTPEEAGGPSGAPTNRVGPEGNTATGPATRLGNNAAERRRPGGR